MKKLMIAMAAVAMIGAANAERLFLTGMAVYAEKDTAPSIENAEAWYSCYAMKLSDAKTMSGATDFSAITKWLGDNFAVNSDAVKKSSAATATEVAGAMSSDPGVSVAYYSFGQLVAEEELVADVIAFCFFNNGTDEAYKVMGDLNLGENQLADCYVGSSSSSNSDYSSGWKAVPEPTSGLLMLLGMAGLALKRKRA